MLIFMLSSPYVVFFLGDGSPSFGVIYSTCRYLVMDYLNTFVFLMGYHRFFFFAHSLFVSSQYSANKITLYQLIARLIYFYKDFLKSGLQKFYIFLKTITNIQGRAYAGYFWGLGGRVEP